MQACCQDQDWQSKRSCKNAKSLARVIIQAALTGLLHLQVHKLVEATKVVRPDWNGYNVLHDSASRVAALDIGFLKSASAATENPKPKFVYLLGSDDYAEEDVPEDAFVVYQVPLSFSTCCIVNWGSLSKLVLLHPSLYSTPVLKKASPSTRSWGQLPSRLLLCVHLMYKCNLLCNSGPSRRQGSPAS